MLYCIEYQTKKRLFFVIAVISKYVDGISSCLLSMEWCCACSGGYSGRHVGCSRDRCRDANRAIHEYAAVILPTVAEQSDEHWNIPSEYIIY
jgi:hypothetical protein